MNLRLEKWRAGILEFTAGGQVDNPFLDRRISAEFTGPSGRKITREAYWDGGNSYKVSFAPTETGGWTYVLAAPENTGLNGKTGIVECIAYTGDLPIYRRGFLKIGGQGKYIAYDDDTPFFWLGDTHWGFIAGEKWNESNHPDMKSMFKGMVDKRREQGFNVYQTNLRSEGGFMGSTHFWVDGKEGLLPDVDFYQTEVDKRMSYLADAGMVNALGFAWGGSVLGKLELQKNLARYIIARYGALPMVWTLAGEVAGYNSMERRACIDGWREVALLVQELDGYKHLRTAHYTNERPFADYYQNEPWFDFTLNQAGHGDYPISGKHYRDHRKQFPGKPFIEGEALYEFVFTLEENGGRVADADMVRRVAYMSIQTGGCGFTYGAQGIWDTVWEKPKEAVLFNPFNPHGITWHEAVDGPGAAQMGYMRAFYEALGFEKFRPFMGCLNSKLPFSDEALFGMFNPYIMAAEDMSLVVLYFTAQTRTIGASIKYLKNRPYQAKWFNPRENKYLPIEEPVIPRRGEWEIPRTPDAKDWLLVVSEVSEGSHA
ncbi:MAG: DUF4038 domain-containing protein [Treponema sp.]|jgi:hypothetical protein|nr:DUF4038 domain-containing protein [Treponema sp.]